MAEGSSESVLVTVPVKVTSALLRLGRGSVETLAKGVLSFIHYGKKQQLPEISNSLILESATILAARIRTGEVSSFEVVKAYIHRIIDVNTAINAVVDKRFSEALEEAAKIDEFIKSGVKTQEEIARVTPLLGVPFTSKEACLVRGLSGSSGLMCRKDHIAVEDCDAVALFRAAGGIPLAVTNTSEVCMWWETYNKLHGQTNNPYDTTRTVGGSSGGEAALIAAAGSLIGLGTDLGGSIRLPCFFTGIFGHKPSPGLVPYGGQFPPALREVSPYVVTGPMCRYAKDLRLLLRVLAGEEAVEKLQLNSEVNIKEIKVYYMFDDGQPARTPLDPELREAMSKVITYLKDEGIVVKESPMPNMAFGFMIWCSCLAKVKEQRITGLMTGGVKPTDDEEESLGQEMVKWFSGKSDHTFPIIFNACMQDHVAPLMKRPLDYFWRKGQELRQEFEDCLKGDAVFLYPTFPTPAQHHGQMIVTPFNTGYSVVFNALGLPVTQCPLGLSQQGLPLGMQIVSLEGQDRLTLALAERIEERFGGWVRL